MGRNPVLNHDANNVLDADRVRNLEKHVAPFAVRHVRQQVGLYKSFNDFLEQPDGHAVDMRVGINFEFGYIDHHGLRRV